MPAGTQQDRPGLSLGSLARVTFHTLPSLVPVRASASAAHGQSYCNITVFDF